MAKVGEISQEKISYDKVEKVKVTTRYSMDAMKNDRTAQDPYSTQTGIQC